MRVTESKKEDQSAQKRRGPVQKLIYNTSQTLKLYFVCVKFHLRLELKTLGNFKISICHLCGFLQAVVVVGPAGPGLGGDDYCDDVDDLRTLPPLRFGNVAFFVWVSLQICRIAVWPQIVPLFALHAAIWVFKFSTLTVQLIVEPFSSM